MKRQHHRFAKLYGSPIRRFLFQIVFFVTAVLWLLLLFLQYRRVQDLSIPGTTTSLSSGIHIADLVLNRYQQHPRPPRDPRAIELERVLQQKQQQQHSPQPGVKSKRQRVGSFNHMPVVWQSGSPLVSRVECVGEDSEIPDDSAHASDRGFPPWQSRSCRFTNLCFDLNTKEYVYFTRDATTSQHNDATTTTTTALSADGVFASNVTTSNQTVLLPPTTPQQPKIIKPPFSVAIGGINPRWDIGHGFDRGSWKAEWFPTIRSQQSSPGGGYYELDPDVVLVPFHSLAGHNVGHLLWDDFYPVYRILKVFGLISSNDHHDGSSSSNDNHKAKIMMLRHVLDKNHTLYANCDIRENKRAQCMNNFVKFLGMLGVNYVTFSTNLQAELKMLQNEHAYSSSLVCTKTAVAGLGMLTDHGFHDHGWENRTFDTTSNGQRNTKRKDLWVPHNLGKGRIFYEFREYLLKRTFPHSSFTPLQVQRQRHITFSVLSSKDWDRRIEFTRQQQVLKTALSSFSYSDEVKVTAYTLWNMPFQEQLQVAVNSHIFISACGGASMTATFLSRGASLILFYNPEGGLDFESFKSNNQPARLDWDLLNHAAAHVRVHWLPLTTMDEPTDLELFVQLILHELEMINML